ncbi:YgfZ/GcvT domain-containing protein [Bartonella sp. DGB2]|uniref:CAF17-like 4Fe-4S cluster assembly/insertion protein YgfZ n=1 Tax=Bartonella sp. DGB2 TaxID=3388426 RepID=UPI00398F9CB4
MIKNYHTLSIKDRKLFAINGQDASAFLQGLITTDIEQIAPQNLLPGALLSAQGKVLFDFLIGRYQNGYLIDIAHDLAPDFIKRLNLYKLRKSVEIIELLQYDTYVSLTNNLPFKDFSLAFYDKRFKKQEKVIRFYLNTSFQTDGQEAHNWKRLCIHHGLAEGGRDYDLGQVFPHDINYDQIFGLSFHKGCYIGQEVVSRMHHRGLIRRRMLIARGESPLPSRAIVSVNGIAIGQLGEAVGHEALALLRLDRVATAVKQGHMIIAAGVPLKVTIAAQMAYDFSDYK